MSHPFFQDHPFFKDDDFETLRLGTAKGRAFATQENIAQNIEKLRKITPRDETQRKRIERLVASLEKQKSGGTQRTTQIPTNQYDPSLTITGSEEVGRGIAAGVRNAAPSMADLALTVPSLLGSDKAKQARSKLQEKMMQNREEVDPRGGAGVAGEVVGGMAAQAIPLGAMASQSARLLKLTDYVKDGKLVVGGATKLAQKLLPKGAGPEAVRRVAGVIENVGGGAPLNVAQALSLDEGTPLAEKLKVLGIGVGADALFGGVQGKLRRSVPLPRGGGVPEAPPELPVKRGAALEATLGKIDKAKEAAELRSQQATQARAEWQVANPGKKWTKDLDAKQRKAIIEAYVAGLPQEGRATIDPETGEQGLGPSGSAPRLPKPPVAGPTVARGGEIPAAGPTAPVGDVSGGRVRTGGEGPKDVPQLRNPNDLVTPTPKGPTTPQVESFETHPSGYVERVPSPPIGDLINPPKDPFQSPVDPLQAKLDELKGKMARGEAPKVDKGPPLTDRELEKGALAKDYDEDIRNFLARLGAARSAEVQKNIQAELDGLAPNMDKIKMIDRHIESIRRSASVYEIKPSEIDAAVNNKDWMNPVDAKKDKANKKLIKDNEDSVVRTLLDHPNIVDKYATIVADLTGETVDQVKARLSKDVPKYYEQELANYKKYLAQATDENSRATWKRAIARIEQSKAQFDKMQSGATADVQGIDPETRTRAATGWNATRPEVRNKILKQLGVTDLEMMEGLDKLRFNHLEPELQHKVAEFYRDKGKNVGINLEDLTPQERANLDAGQNIDEPRYPRTQEEEQRAAEQWTALSQSDAKRFEQDTDNPKMSMFQWRDLNKKQRQDFIDWAANNLYNGPRIEFPDNPDPSAGTKLWWGDLSKAERDQIARAAGVNPEVHDMNVNWDSLREDLRGYIEPFVGQRPKVPGVSEGSLSAWYNELNAESQRSILGSDVPKRWKDLTPEQKAQFKQWIEDAEKGVGAGPDDELESAENIWNRSDADQREIILQDIDEQFDIGLTDEQITYMAERYKYSDLAKKLRDYMDEFYGFDKEVETRKTNNLEDVGIRIKPGQTFGEWWAEATPQMRQGLLSDFRGEMGYEMTARDEELLLNAPLYDWEAKFLQEFNEWFKKYKIGGEGGGLDVGREFYEPSAAERLARVRFPDDLKQELFDFVIDSETSNLDQAQFLESMRKFAAQHELTPEQVQAGLNDIGYDPSHPPELNPGAPTLDPTITDPAQLNQPSPLLDPSTLPPGQDQRIAALSDAEIDSFKEAMFKRLDANVDDKDAIHMLNKLAEETRRRHGEKVAEQQAGYDMMQKLNKPKDSIQPMDPQELAKLARTSPRKLDNNQLDRLIDEVGTRIGHLTEAERKTSEWTKLQDKLLAEKAQRTRPGPLDAQLPPSVFGSAAGFTYGMTTGEDEDRANRALMYALLGGAGAHLLARKWIDRKGTMRAESPEMFPGQKGLPNVVSYLEDRGAKASSAWMSRVRRFYSGMVRSNAELEHVYAQGGGSNLPIYYSAAKRAAIFGRWIGKSEYALTHGPILEVNGEPISLGALPPVKIKDLARSEIQNLDELSIARTVLEQMTKNPSKAYPMDQLRAVMTVKSAPEYLHQAADELRKLALAGVQIAADGGLVDPKKIALFASEVWYASLQRVFGDGVLRKDLKKIITSPQPIKGREGGSHVMVKSPFESSIEMLPRVIRAAEYNKIKQQFIAFVRTMPKDAQKGILTRVERTKNADALDFYKDQIEAIRALIPDLSAEDAANLATSFSEQLTKDSPHMTVYEDGVLRSYRLNESLFDAFKAMTPLEHGAFLSLVGKGTQLASKGIVNHPWFIAMQSVFVEPFQAGLQSSYGFIPYLDNIKGWWNIVSGSPAYKKILSTGGVGSIQSLPYATVKSAIKESKTGGSTPIEKAINHMKQFEPWQAYKSLATPAAEAARMGEALRALGHGASTLDAAYAAWHVLGNTRQEGNFAAMRAFNLITLFSRPAISALDEMVTKMGVHPLREPRTSHSTYASVARAMGVSNDRAISGSEFALKGFAYLTLPSILLWYATKDDQEIRELRQTESGQRYWFFRTPEGSIGRVRKPHVIGQMFGSTAEAILDQAYNMDPSGESTRWIDGLVNDATFNMLPQIGVIPASLLANRTWGFGSQIVPDATREPELTGFERGSNPARVVSEILNPLSSKLDPDGFWTGALRRATTPAGLDFIMNNLVGIVGQDALKAVDAAVSTVEDNLPPAKEELPIVGRLFVKYPSMNTRAVRDFYNEASKSEIAANSLRALLQTSPQSAATYIEDHKLELALAPAYTSARKEIAGFNRAILELKELARKGEIPADQFSKVEKQFLTVINQIAAATIEASRKGQNLVQ